MDQLLNDLEEIQLTADEVQDSTATTSKGIPFLFCIKLNISNYCK